MLGTKIGKNQRLYQGVELKGRHVYVYVCVWGEKGEFRFGYVEFQSQMTCTDEGILKRTSKMEFIVGKFAFF